MWYLIPSQVQRKFWTNICWIYYLSLFFLLHLLFPSRSFLIFPHRQKFSSSFQTNLGYLKGSGQCEGYVGPFFLVSVQYFPHLWPQSIGDVIKRPGTDTLTKAKTMADLLSHSRSNLSPPVTSYFLFLLNGTYWQDTTSHTDPICKLQNGVGWEHTSPMHTRLGHMGHPCACYKRHPFLWQTQPQVRVPDWWEKWESWFSLDSLPE